MWKWEQGDERDMQPAIARQGSATTWHVRRGTRHVQLGLAAGRIQVAFGSDLSGRAALAMKKIQINLSLRLCVYVPRMDLLPDPGSE
jgi:hypothetical protein